MGFARWCLSVPVLLSQHRQQHLGLGLFGLDGGDGFRLGSLRYLGLNFSRRERYRFQRNWDLWHGFRWFLSAGLGHFLQPGLEHGFEFLLGAQRRFRFRLRLRRGRGDSDSNWRLGRWGGRAGRGGLLQWFESLHLCEDFRQPCPSVTTRLGVKVLAGGGCFETRLGLGQIVVSQGVFGQYVGLDDLSLPANGKVRLRQVFTQHLLVGV